MRITIAERLRPYQHIAGTKVLLPGTVLRATIFPAMIQLHDLSQAEPKLIKEIPLRIEGPVKDFTVQQDLEKECLVVWGFSQVGYFRYRIVYDNGVQILFDKGGESFKFDVSSVTSPFFDSCRLSLGNHKAQDWSLVKRRLDMKEIIPHWIRLGQLVPKMPLGSRKGTVELLAKCQEALDQKAKLEIVSRLETLFSVGFEGILSPRLSDTQHQGIPLTLSEPGDSPLVLLSEGFQMILSLFIQADKNHLSVLPVLPPEFHSGRLIRYHWKGFGYVDIEWSKKVIKKMMFTAEVISSVRFTFQKEVQRFRLNGTYYPIDQQLDIQPNQKYLFDCFEK